MFIQVEITDERLKLFLKFSLSLFSPLGNELMCAKNPMFVGHVRIPLYIDTLNNFRKAKKITMKLSQGFGIFSQPFL